MPRPGAVATALVSRDLTRLWRQPSRVVGVVGQALVFWFLLGSGVGANLRVPGAAAGTGYAGYFFAGALALVVLFASIFANISVIEDRKEGFLALAQVAPVSRLELALGKTLGGTALGFLQGLIMLVMAPLAGIPLSIARLLWGSAALLVLSLALSSLGLALAWVTESSQGYHGVMSFILFPMWMLSGAIFPTSGLPAWLLLLVRVNPLTYAVAALRATLLPPAIAAAGSPGSLALCWWVMTGFALAGVVLAWITIRRGSAGSP